MKPRNTFSTTSEEPRIDNLRDNATHRFRPSRLAYLNLIDFFGRNLKGGIRCRCAGIDYGLEKDFFQIARFGGPYSQPRVDRERRPGLAPRSIIVRSAKTTPREASMLARIRATSTTSPSAASGIEAEGRPVAWIASATVGHSACEPPTRARAPTPWKRERLQRGRERDEPRRESPNKQSDCICSAWSRNHHDLAHPVRLPHRPRLASAS